MYDLTLELGYKSDLVDTIHTYVTISPPDRLNSEIVLSVAIYAMHAHLQSIPSNSKLFKCAA